MKNKWEKPHCNFCGSRQYKVVWDKVTTWIFSGEFQIVCCKNCNLVYLSPRPKKKYISNYYSPKTYWGMDLTKSKNEAGIKRRGGGYDFIYKQILKRKKDGKILDLGAGTGLFLSEFKKLGWDTTGVELSRNACEYAKDVYKLNLINASFPEVKLPPKCYDTITFNGCLEHLYEPKESLAKAYKLLKNGGFVEINVPNFDSLGRLIFGKRWYALQPPSHLYHFTPNTILKVMREIGFKDMEISHNDWNQNIYILFETLRLTFSPKFKSGNVGNFVRTTQAGTGKRFSIKMESGKMLAKTTSFILAFFELFVKRGEVITIYAKKY